VFVFADIAGMRAVLASVIFQEEAYEAARAMLRSSRAIATVLRTGTRGSADELGGGLEGKIEEYWK